MSQSSKQVEQMAPGLHLGAINVKISGVAVPLQKS
jgi:hypothetical protein